MGAARGVRKCKLDLYTVYCILYSSQKIWGLPAGKD